METAALHDRIARNLTAIRRRIADAAGRSGRDPASVRLIAVTKTVGMAEIRALHAAGVTEMGENRVEVAQSKVAEGPKDIVWHMIGPLQTRKAPEVVETFSHFDAVDRIRAAEALQRRCDEQNRTLRVLVEVNVSGECSKHGFEPGQLEQVVSEMRSLDRLRLDGLMTMAPFGAEEAFLRRCFRGLKKLAEMHGLQQLSMGMTDDYEIAIEEGATQVRIGRALFEDAHCFPDSAPTA